MNSIDEQFIREELDESLLNCVLEDNGKIIFENCSGRLYFDKQKKTRLLATSVQVLDAKPFETYIPSGLLKFNAKTKGGQELQATVLQAHINRLYLRTGLMDWVLDCDCIELHTLGPTLPQSSLYGFISTVEEPIFDRVTKTQTTGFSEHHVGSSRDWLMFDAIDTNFRIKKQEGITSVISLSMPNCSKDELL